MRRKAEDSVDKGLVIAYRPVPLDRLLQPEVAAMSAMWGWLQDFFLRAEGRNDQQGMRLVMMGCEADELRFAGYYNALSAYHEHAGEWDKVLHLREAHWDNVRGRGRLHDEAFVLTRRCEALARLGRLTDGDLARARQAAGRLAHPDRVLDELARWKAPCG
jgi:hypothetical protein